MVVRMAARKVAHAEFKEKSPGSEGIKLITMFFVSK